MPRAAHAPGRSAAARTSTTPTENRLATLSTTTSASVVARPGSSRTAFALVWSASNPAIAIHTQAEKIWNENANPPYLLRSHDDFARFFDGLELIEPGVTSAPAWRPQAEDPKLLDVVCGVGRKN